MEKILYAAGKKSAKAFNVDVFPEAVPPQKRIDAPFSMASQKYAAISNDIVPVLIKSIGVKGSSRNLLMVNVENGVTVFANIIDNRFIN
jgi:hypothetical protein